MLMCICTYIRTYYKVVSLISVTLHYWWISSLLIDKFVIITTNTYLNDNNDIKASLSFSTISSCQITANHIASIYKQHICNGMMLCVSLQGQPWCFFKTSAPVSYQVDNVTSNDLGLKVCTWWTTTHSGAYCAIVIPKSCWIYFNSVWWFDNTTGCQCHHGEQWTTSCEDIWS